MTEAEQYVDSITKLIQGKYPNRKMLTSGDGANFSWREKLAEKSYAAISVVAAQNRATLILIGTGGENQKPQLFDCGRDSANKIAQVICDWIEAREKEVDSHAFEKD